MKINELIIKDIRSFAGEQRLAIRPITYLVGENSTGKTTALACLQVIGSQYARSSLDMSRLDNVVENFNIEPYQMGAFGEIVRKTKPPLQEFTLGMIYGDVENRTYEQKITFAKDDDSHERETSIRQVEWRFKNGTIIIVPGKGNGKIGIKFEKSKKSFIISTRYLYDVSIHFLLRIYDYIDGSGDIFTRVKATEECLVALKEFLKENNLTGKESRRNFRKDRAIFSIAPIRSKPQRTYDTFKRSIMPEGDDTPHFLMNLYSKNKREWERLRGELVAFGKKSELFEDIDIKILDASFGASFQLYIKTKGMISNLIDVGYGVSQILPILVRTYTKENSTFLIQQPELHLHPKGQAALASLLIEHTKTRGNNYVIETHSDYMIDRTRIEISKELVAPEYVSLVFLERKKKNTKVHNITFDNQAEFVGLPESYSDFFIEETNKLIGFE